MARTNPERSWKMTDSLRQRIDARLHERVLTVNKLAYQAGVDLGLMRQWLRKKAELSEAEYDRVMLKLDLVE